MFKRAKVEERERERLVSSQFARQFFANQHIKLNESYTLNILSPVNQCLPIYKTGWINNIFSSQKWFSICSHTFSACVSLWCLSMLSQTFSSIFIFPLNYFIHNHLQSSNWKPASQPTHQSMQATPWYMLLPEFVTSLIHFMWFLNSLLSCMAKFNHGLCCMRTWVWARTCSRSLFLPSDLMFIWKMEIVSACKPNHSLTQSVHNCTLARWQF